jgi:hypothetical protein
MFLYFWTQLRHVAPLKNRVITNEASKINAQKSKPLAVAGAAWDSSSKTRCLVRAIGFSSLVRLSILLCTTTNQMVISNWKRDWKSRHL